MTFTATDFRSRDFRCLQRFTLATFFSQYIGMNLHVEVLLKNSKKRQRALTFHLGHGAFFQKKYDRRIQIPRYLGKY